ncbi:hypothetical protein [Enterovibrio norvegicus]|uniref:hypothetical protein n=1 Tax=Enterovibrio norvegicus TaxID=188144 RepID=UPI00352EB601
MTLNKAKTPKYVLSLTYLERDCNDVASNSLVGPKLFDVAHEAYSHLFHDYVKQRIVHNLSDEFESMVIEDGAYVLKDEVFSDAFEQIENGDWDTKDALSNFRHSDDIETLCRWYFTTVESEDTEAFFNIEMLEVPSDDDENDVASLLAGARNCLSELIDSAFLDVTEMANDCLEVFDNYEWEPKSDLSETDGIRWSELLQKGNDGKLEDKELSEFLELTSPEGQTHTYYHRIQARKLVDSI